MTLAGELSGWDEKSKSAIEAIYSNHIGESDFLDQLIAALPQQPLQSAASWLIKHGMEQNQFIPNQAQESAMVSTLSDVTAPWARLHMLQILEKINIPEQAARLVDAYLKESITSDNKFTRAWAFSGFHTLAKQHPRYQKQAQEMLQQAMKEEIADSVLARVRKKLNEGF